MEEEEKCILFTEGKTRVSSANPPSRVCNMLEMDGGTFFGGVWRRVIFVLLGHEGI